MLDVFNSNPFSSVALTSAVERNPYNPRRLGQLGIFTPTPIRTRTFAVEERTGTLSLVPTTAIGAPPSSASREARVLRELRTVRLAVGDTIYAEELQGIREFGQETVEMQVMAEVNRRLNGPVGLRARMEMTKEYQRVGAIQGRVYDSDGSTVLVNLFTEFNVSEPAEVDWDLDNASPASGAVRKLCNSTIRAMAKASQGAFVNGMTSVLALCGDAFWDDLTAHSEVRGTYLNTVQAQQLRETVGAPYETFRYGGITWENYRSTDNGTTVTVGTDKVRFVPINAPGVFLEVMSPAEFEPWINTAGKPEYVLTFPDRDRQAWQRFEVYSYGLMICTRPEMLLRGKRT